MSFQEAWEPWTETLCIHLVGRGDLGVVVNKLFDNVCVTSASRPRQARHVMLQQQQQQKHTPI